MDPFGPSANLPDYAEFVIRTKAKQLSRQRGFASHEEEDLRQDMSIHLIQQLNKYDSTRGNINTFCYTVIDNHAAMIARDRCRLKRGGGIRPLSLDVEHPSEHRSSSLSDALTPLDLGRRLGLVPKPKISPAAIQAAVTSLPSELQAVCCELMIGTVNSTARNLNISRSQLRNMIKQIRHRFRSLDLNDW